MFPFADVKAEYCVIIYNDNSNQFTARVQMVFFKKVLSKQFTNNNTGNFVGPATAYHGRF